MRRGPRYCSPRSRRPLLGNPDRSSQGARHAAGRCPDPRPATPAPNEPNRAGPRDDPPTATKRTQFHNRIFGHDRKTGQDREIARPNELDGALRGMGQTSGHPADVACDRGRRGTNPIARRGTNPIPRRSRCARAERTQSAGAERTHWGNGQDPRPRSACPEMPRSMKDLRGVPSKSDPETRGRGARRSPRAPWRGEPGPASTRRGPDHRGVVRSGQSSTTLGQSGREARKVRP